MKILVVGGSGTIGQAVVRQLRDKHDVLVGTYTLGRGDVQVDISDSKSIAKMYKKVGKLDAVIAATGKVHFETFNHMNEQKYQIGLNHKLMGQVNLVLLGLEYMNNEGSFTLTSGILSEDPIVQGSSAAMVNGAIDAFVKAVSIELERGLRINSVSPTVIAEAMKSYAPFFPGYKPVTADEAALAYVKSVCGKQTGQVYCAGY